MTKQPSISPDDLSKAPISELYEKLKSGEQGISNADARERLERYGRNEIIEHKKNPVVKFLKSFWGPMAWLIEIAALLSAAIGHWADFGIILTLLALNAVVGFWQEFKADTAISLLKQSLALKARALRDGRMTDLPAAELVPGDVVRIRLGDIVPADVRLIKGDYLQVDESALTGESLPVDKTLSDMAYSGSVIRQGEMSGIVVSTGMNTFFGRTAQLMEQAATHSHFQKAVIKISNYLIILAFALIMLIFVVALFRHERIMEFLQFALVLIVAAIPAALPTVMSVTMAVGATALAKKEAIVSRLASIEEMAGMDILCSDKTGTITKNELTVADVLPLDGYDTASVLRYAALASDPESKDPIDSAIISKISSIRGITGYPASAETFKPFDPVSKRTEAAIKGNDGTLFKVSKGAPQVILEMVGDKDIAAEIERGVLSFAEHGYRALGVAHADQDGAWRFAGLIPLYDPPREDSAETIRIAQSMGVEVKMITGDHTAIAKETAKLVGLKTNILPAGTFIKETERNAYKIVEEANGFAQVFPEHKYHIVELLQSRDHIVGMTGDGVNDAPALKKADAGIAVAGATDAAKSAAAIVLTKPGLSVIIDAIMESRKIFARMENYAIYRIAETIRVILFITASIIAFRFYPVTALMIVLLALLNDAPIISISSDNVAYSHSPDRWNMRTTLGIATFLGVIGVFSSFFILFIGKELLQLDNEALQSFIYLKLSVAGHLTLFVARTRGHFWSIRPSLTLLLAVVITQLIATLITAYGILLPALGWGPVLFVWGYALMVFFITDVLKVEVYKVLDHTDVQFKHAKH